VRILSGVAPRPATRFSEVRRFDVLDSTNLYLLERARAGEPEGLVAVADEQTAGRGRLGRAWIAPPRASLLVSVLLRPQLPGERRHLVTIAAALAAVDALGRFGCADARVKWPNDVVIRDRKCAGLLAESDGAGAVVVGMGCNLRDDWFPPELRETATAWPVDRDELLDAWLAAYDVRLDDLDSVLDDTRAQSATIGRRVRIELANETFEGVARDFTPEGFLVVDDRVVTAGDIIHLRPV
jgi:BirA family biotin operon repressor/biotin-[acetyl-CoA-carboxylase] ligase